jgi:hypothetical protein
MGKCRLRVYLPAAWLNSADKSYGAVGLPTYSPVL